MVERVIDMKECGRGCRIIDVISQNLPGGTEENYENPSPDILCSCLGPNTSVQPYRHTNLFAGNGLQVSVKMDI
jgi:hypothetical protein